MKILEGGPLLSPFGLDILPTFLGDFRLVATDPKRASIRSPSTLKESPSTSSQIRVSFGDSADDQTSAVCSSGGEPEVGSGDGEES